MEDVRQKEISRDLDQYISSKRKGSGLFGMFNKKEDDGTVPLHPYVKPYDDEPLAVAQETAPAAVEDAQPTEAGAHGAHEKKGWFSRWFAADETAVAEEAAPFESVAEDDADLREVARIALGFLRQTDQDALARIKSSPDFEKFKDILRRRHIIK